MAVTSEQGMARILGSFEKLIAAVSTMGPQYNPGNGALAIAALHAQHAAARLTFEAVDQAHAPYSLSVDQRETAFAATRSLPARVRNSAKALNLGPEVIRDMDTIIRQLQGRRRSTTAAARPAAAVAETTGTAPATISTSQQSYDHKVAQLSGLVTLLSNLPQYMPNEAELQVSGIQALLHDLQQQNTAVTRTAAALTAARIPRFDAIYAPVTGLVDTANAVKAYVRAAFGTASPQWHQVRSLIFRPRKR